MLWIVKLTKTPTTYVYKEGFFPRYMVYKKEAQELVNEVRRVGGDAELQEITNKKGVPKRRIQF